MSNKLDKNLVENIVGLTPLQEGMLFHHLFTTESDDYKVQLSIEFCGVVSVPSIKNAWYQIIQDNALFRTVFRWENIQSPIQVVLKEVPDAIEIVNLRNFEKNEQIYELAQLRKKILNEKFQLENIPYRIHICLLDETKFEMILTNHHILFDGWSTGIIVKEFLTRYNDLQKGKSIQPLKKKGFDTFIKAIRNADKIKQNAYWTQVLEGYEKKLLIPKSSNNLQALEKHGTYKSFINEELFLGLDQLSKEHNVTFSTLIYTAWGILLKKLSLTNDVLFGTTVSGRNIPLQGIEEMVGLFINTLPMRVSSNKQTTILQLLADVQTQLINSGSFSSTALVDINQILNIKAQAPFESIVVIENYPLDTLVNKNDLLKITNVYEQNASNFDIALVVQPYDNSVLFKFNGNLFNEEFIMAINDAFIYILTQIFHNPSQNINNLKVLPAEKSQLLIQELNPSYLLVESKQTIIDLFSSQIRSCRNSIVIKEKNNYITYNELDQCSNQLAHF
ncbi:condensation domain-containing protein, partial [Peribacillus simplex]|uniref:condensation domain-containing protein n=1 Tax=Peribacillus simplex TaxID=1478 RepID=UPI003D2AC7E1